MQGSILFRLLLKEFTRFEESAVHVSSMYLLQNCGGVWKVDSMSCSTSSMTRFATMDLLVYLALKGQVGGLQAKLEQGVDVSLGRVVLSGIDGTFIS